MKKYIVLCTSLFFAVLVNAQLYVATGESINVVNNNQLFVQENLQNNGAIERLTINGNNTIAISGIGSINYLTINKSSGNNTIVSGQQTINNELIPTAGSLTTGGNLKLASTSTNTARVAVGNSAGGYLLGNVLVQRFIDGGYRKFRFIGHPFDAPLNVTELTDDIDITGNVNSGNTNNFTATSSNNPSAFYFDESLDDGQYTNNNISNNGWVAYTGTTPTNINAGNGLRVLIRGSKAQTNSLTGGVYTPDAVSISMNGQLKQGDFTQNLQYTSANINKGWNLISNPYASNIDWLLVTKNYVDDAIYTYLPRVDGGRYATYINGSSTNGGSNYIENNSSFFVHTNANNPSINWQEINKVNNQVANSSFKATPITHNRYLLKIKNNTTGFSDEVIIRFGETKATEGFDSKLDAYHLPTNQHNFFVLDANKVSYAIYHGSELKNKEAEKRVIQLGFTNAVKGTYTFSATELNALALGNKMCLKDNYTKGLIEIQNNMLYEFEVNADTASQQYNRFSIVFNPENKLPIKPSSISLQITPNPSSDIITVFFNQPTALNTIITITDALGRELYTSNIGNTTSANISIPIKSWINGLYYLTIENSKESITKKIIKQ